MELWQWFSTNCCARRHRAALPGAPAEYVASLQRGADREVVAEWQRRMSDGYCEIFEGRLVEHGNGFRTAKDVKAGCALLFEASACSAPAGPVACETMAQQLAQGHERCEEVTQLKSDRFTGLRMGSK
eukprot:Skav226986  [mRNA]  locus=scaffold1937:147259:153528:+ [translate_table: standard]